MKAYPQPLLVLVLLLSLASTYHVDSTDGSDANSGTESAPWKTIAKVNSTTLAPGDSVLFRRGQIWREALILRRDESGTQSAPITFGAYSQGERPRIVGADVVTGWVRQSGPVWKAPLNWATTKFAPEPEMVFFNGARGDPQHGPESIDKPLEWCWRDGALYVYGESDPGAAIEISARDYCIYAPFKADADFIVVEDLELEKANHKNLNVESDNDHWSVRRVRAHHCGALGGNDKQAFNFSDSAGHKILECTIYESAGNNVNVVQCCNVSIEKCTSYDSHHHCIDIKGGFTGAPARNNAVIGNTVYLSPGFASPTGVNGIFAGLGDSQPLTNTRICNNIVYDMSGNGIHIDRNADGVDVRNNIVVNCGSADFYIVTTGAVSLLNNVGVAQSGGRVLSVISGLDAKKIDRNCWFCPASIFAQTSRDAATYETFPSFAAWSSATGFDSNSICADPGFIDCANHNYRFRPDSPCIRLGIAQP